MYKILFCAGLRQAEAADLLHQASIVVNTVMPSVVPCREWQERLLPGIGGGWSYQVPFLQSRIHLITEHVDDECAVLAFGRLFHAAPPLASIVAATWRAANGPVSVSSLDGSFSAIIVDRKSHEVWVTGDGIGRRTLRYSTDAEALIVSTHDIPLLATGFCRGTPDSLSLASSMAFDWSLGGRPLVTDIRRCRPATCLHWTNGRLEEIQLPGLMSHDVLDPNDTQGVTLHLDTIAGSLSESVAWFLEGVDRVRTDLTAGIDSRVVLALLKSLGPGCDIECVTTGSSRSLDVRVARRLAERCELPIHVLPLQAADVDGFQRGLRILAAYINGDTNGKRAAGDLMQQAYFRDDIPHLYGLGSEILRGYYYPVGIPASKLTSDMIVPAIIRHSRLPGIVLSSEDLRHGVTTRLEEVVEKLRCMGQSPQDVLDLYYAYERFGVWGALSSGGTWWSQYFAPFDSPHITRMGLRLPVRTRASAGLQCRIIRKHLRGLYYWPPVNERDYLPAMSHPTLAHKVARPLVIKSNAVQRKVRLWRNPSLSTLEESEDQEVRRLFSTTYAPFIRETLLAQGSFAAEVAGRENITRMLDEHCRGIADHTGVIGILLVASEWQSLVTKTLALAGRRTVMGGAHPPAMVPLLLSDHLN